MIRIVSAGIGGLVLASGVASAAFVGIDIREDKGFDIPELPGDVRTFNLYAQFDSNDFADAIVSVGQPDATTGWGINTDVSDGATFFQVGAPFGGDTAPDSGFFGFEATLPADSFVTIGVKDSANGDATSLDPDFGFSADFITGGWFNSNPPNRQGEGQLNDDNGLYETLIAQVTIQGLADGASIGESGGTSPRGDNGNGGTATTWFGTILTGEMTIFNQGPTGGAQPNIVTFDIPTPGAAALFGVAGLAGIRRRRA